MSELVPHPDCPVCTGEEADSEPVGDPAMSGEPTLIERLQHFEKNQLEVGDQYGAEVLHNAVAALIGYGHSALAPQEKT